MLSAETEAGDGLPALVDWGHHYWRFRVVPNVEWIGRAVRTLTNLASCRVSLLTGRKLTVVPDIEHRPSKGAFGAKEAAEDLGKVLSVMTPVPPRTKNQ